MDRRIVTAVVGVAAAGLLAGCGGGGDGGGRGKDTPGASGTRGGGPTAAKAAAPIIPLTQAQAVLTRYDTVNNAANATLDAVKLSTVEAGALFQQSSAQYKQFPKYTAEVRAAYKRPSHHADPQFAIPATGSWFMVSAAVRGGNYPAGERQLMVFQKQSDGGWKMVVADNYLGALPAVAKGPGGAATVVAPDATVAGTKLPGLAAAAGDLFVSGGKKAGAALADTAVKRDTVKAYTDRNTHWGKYRTCLRSDFENPGAAWDTPYTTFPGLFAVRTADGGALIAATSYVVRLDFSTRPDQCGVVPSDETAVYVHPGAKGDVPGIRSRLAALDVISVPAAGRPALLGGDTQLVGATR